MNPSQQRILDYLQGTTSTQAKTTPDIYNDSGVNSIAIQPALDSLYSKGMVNRCQVTKGTLSYMTYWSTGFKGVAMTKDPIPTFSKEPKVKSQEPASWTALKQSKSQPNEGTDMADRPFKAAQIRELLDATDVAGISHEELILKLTNNSTDKYLIRKAIDMIAYTINAGGYTKRNVTSIENGSMVKRYFKNSLASHAKDAAKLSKPKPASIKKVADKVKALKAEKPVAEPVTPVNSKQVESHGKAVFNDFLNVFLTAGQTPAYPSINIKLQVEMPTMPNTVKIKGLRKSNLDDALNGGEDYNIDVALLDDLAVHSFIGEWSVRFKTHVQARRELLNNARG